MTNLLFLIKNSTNLVKLVYIHPIEKNSNNIDRYREAVTPSVFMGIVTNIYILGILWFIDGLEIALSPIIGTFLFVFVLILMRKNKITTNQTFFILAYVVCIEVWIHIHYLGWNSGFYYFMFLLIMVFLLNYNWSRLIFILYNASIVVCSITFWYFYHTSSGKFNLDIEVQNNLNRLNLLGIFGVILIIVIYFSRSLHNRDEVLNKVNVKLIDQNKKISLQQQRQELLIKEIHHRVKNNLQIISSLMSLQSRRVTDDEMLEVLNQSRSRVDAIAMIHHKLYQHDNIQRVDFGSYLNDVLNCQKVLNPKLDCKLESVKSLLHLDIAVPLGIIVSEMMTNSLKHAFKGVDNPKIVVKLTENNGSYKLLIQDNGIGLTNEFDLQNPTSLGTEIIAALISQIDAKLECSLDTGTSFKITFKDKLVDNN